MIMRVIGGWGRCGSRLLSSKVGEALGSSPLFQIAPLHGDAFYPVVKTRCPYPPGKGKWDVAAVFLYGKIEDVVGSMCAQSLEWMIAHCAHCGGDIARHALADETGAAARYHAEQRDCFRMADAMDNWSAAEVPVVFVDYDTLWSDGVLPMIERHLSLPDGSLVSRWPKKEPRSSSPVKVGDGYARAQMVLRSLRKEVE